MFPDDTNIARRNTIAEIAKVYARELARVKDAYAILEDSEDKI